MLSSQASVKRTDLLPRADVLGNCEVARTFGLFPATDSEIEQAHDMAGRLIGAKLTSVDDLQALQRVFPASVLVHREEGGVTGVFAYMLLRPDRMSAVWDGALDPLALDFSLCALPGEPTSGAYSLGFAGTTKPARRAVVQGAWGIGQQLYGSVPSFTRAATEDGRRVVVDVLGYRPLSPGSDIYWFEPRGAGEEAA